LNWQRAERKGLNAIYLGLGSSEPAAARRFTCIPKPLALASQVRVAGLQRQQQQRAAAAAAAAVAVGTTGA